MLPAKLRAASVISALLFFAAFYVVLAREGLVGLGGKSAPARIAVWVFAAIFGVSTLANVAPRSRWERFFMAPIGLVLTACCGCGLGCMNDDPRLERLPTGVIERSASQPRRGRLSAAALVLAPDVRRGAVASETAKTLYTPACE